MGFLDYLPVVGDLIGGVSSVISTNMANRQSIKNQREAQAWSEGMNAQQQEWQEKMWNMTNEYNSPVNQMQRAMEAGINPNSVVGGAANMGSATMAQQPAIPSVSAAQAFPYDLGMLRGLGDHLRQATLFKTEKENIEADTEQKLANAGTADANAKLMLEQAKGIKLENEVKPDMLQATLDNLKKQADEIISRIDLNNEQKRQVKYTVDEILPLTKDMTIKQIDEVTQQIATGIATEAHQYAAASRERAEAGLAGAETQQVREITKGIKVDNSFKEIHNRLQKAKTAAEIMSLDLSNYEKNYFVRQLRKFGFNVSENKDITMLAKFAMLRAKGFMDEDTYDMLSGKQRSGDVRKGLEGIGENVLNVATQIISAWIMGKAMGKGIGSSSKGVSPGTKSLQSPPGGWSNSTSTVNPIY